METMKWELREKYDVQDRQYQAVRERYDRAVVEAGTRLQDLKSEQGALLREEFRTGADMSAAKAKLRAKIEQAEKEKEAAELERVQAYDYARAAAGIDRISVRDLVKDWNQNYRPAVREAELNPIVDKMAEARRLYLEAVLEFYRLRDTYSGLYNEMRDLSHADNANHPGNHLSVNSLVETSDLPLLTDAQLSFVGQQKKLPEEI